jgi:uncharacterized repeat protein (TIGR01451 family)
VVQSTGTYVYTPTGGYSGPDSFGYQIRDEAGQMANGTVNLTVTPAANLVDPPSGTKVVNSAGLPNLVWTMDWINIGSAPATNVTIVDPIPAGTTYLSHVCTPNGATTAPVCIYEPANNRVVYQGTVAPGGANHLVITLTTTWNGVTDIVRNQACATNGNPDNRRCTDDPGTQASGDPTVWRRPGGGGGGGGGGSGPAMPIPSLSVWAMWLLASMLLMLGGLGMRRGRQPK